MSLLFALLLPLVLTPQDPPDKALKSKDPLVRLAAVETLAKEDHPKREKLLIGVLDDDDWEVVERAATVLADVGGEDSIKPLVKLTLEGPVRRVRRTAAESLAKLDAAEGYAGVAKKVASKQAAAACQAIVVLAPALVDEDVSLKAAEKALKSKEAPAREAAARALIALAGDGRAERLADLLTHEEVAVRCAAVETAGAVADPAGAAPLLDALGGDELPDVVERRCIAALGAILTGVDGGERKAVAAECLALEPTGEAALARAARLKGRVGTKGLGLADASDAVAALGGALGSSADGARAAAAEALGRIASDAALERVSGLARDDASPRVRRTAMRALTAARPASDDAGTLDLCVTLLKDADAGVREDAAVALGYKGADAAMRPLVQALGDAEWGVAACAAVSLGKTRAEGAINPLAKLANHEDWRLRGAAVVGLGHLYQKDAIPHVIAAIGDDEAVVRRTAWEYLCAVADRRLDPEQEVWQTWWTENEKRIVLFDPEEEKARREKYGYTRTPTEIYQGLDVVVFESRGDHIQNVLKDLDVEHRLTSQGRVGEAEAHARSVFVSNCTGEMTPDDIGRLAWFVRVGGYLFGSCWAVQETVARVVPGVVRRLPTRGEVLDNVFATPCTIGSPYLEGVFGPDVRPMYALEGAYLIDVVDPERCEVLIDSPECYDRWGGGNLAAWFTAGHGVVLDSVNHFEEQGLVRATWLKKPEERMAFAVDHMGLTYEELREVRGEKFWKKSQQAAEQVKDLSVFRLITNFVRQKRIAGDG
ncbi:MAG: HEAT repeat domain-containing protein [Planctomycetota bacterium]